MATPLISAEALRKQTRGWWGKLSGSRALLADSGALFISNAANGVLGLVFWILAARLYAPEHVGLGSAMISAMYLLGNISRLGLDVALMRKLPTEPSIRRRHGLVVGSLLIVAATGVCASAIFVLQPSFALEARQPIRASGWAIAGFIICCAAWGVSLVLDQTLIALGRSGDVVRKNLAFSVVKLAALPLLVSFMSRSLGIFGANALGVAAGLMIIMGPARAFFVQPLRLVRQGLADVRASLVGYALWNHCSMLIAGLPNWLLPILVAERIGISAAGHFYTGWMLMTLLSTAPTALATGCLSQGARRQHDAAAMVRRIAIYTLAAVIPGAIVLSVGASWLLAVFGKSYTENSADMLRYLFISTIPMTIVQFAQTQLRLAGKLWALNATSIILTATTLLLSFALLPALGLQGVGVAWLAACTGAAVFCLWCTSARRV